MDKQTYLEQLRFHLAGRMPVNEVERVIQYYSDQFDAAQAGDTAVMQDLGDPQALAQDLVDDFLNLKTAYDRRQQAPKKKRSLWLPVMLVAVLGLCSFAIPFSLFRGAVSTPVLTPIRGANLREVPSAAAVTLVEEAPFAETISNGAAFYTDVPFIDDFYCDVDSADIQFALGDSYSIQVNHVDGAPKIEVDYDYGYLSITGFSDFPSSFNLSDESSNILITIPDGGAMASFSISNDLGSVSITGQTINGTLSIDSDMGSVFVSDTTANSMEFDLDTGDLDLRNVKTDYLYADCDLGKIAGSAVAAGSMDLDCDVGSIEIDGEFYGNTNISADVGRVSFTTSLPESEYRVEAYTDIGSLTINGQSQRGNSASWGEGENSLYIDADVGSVELNFGS